MHNKILLVVLLSLANSKIFANPIAKEIVQSNIESTIFPSHVDIIKAKRASNNPSPRLWCPSNSRFEPIIPMNYPAGWTDPPGPKNPNPNHPKDNCPHPEYPILVTCPTDSRFPPGGMKVVTIENYEYSVISRLQQCSYGELICCCFRECDVDLNKTGIIVRNRGDENLPKLEQYCCKTLGVRFFLQEILWRNLY